MGVSMETTPFTMTSFQSAYGQVVAWCKYSSSETDGKIASYLYDNSTASSFLLDTELHFTLDQHRLYYDCLNGPIRLIYSRLINLGEKMQVDKFFLSTLLSGYFLSTCIFS